MRVSIILYNVSLIHPFSLFPLPFNFPFSKQCHLCCLNGLAVSIIFIFPINPSHGSQNDLSDIYTFMEGMNLPSSKPHWCPVSSFSMWSVGTRTGRALTSHPCRTWILMHLMFELQRTTSKSKIRIVPACFQAVSSSPSVYWDPVISCAPAALHLYNTVTPVPLVLRSAVSHAEWGAPRQQNVYFTPL